MKACCPAGVVWRLRAIVTTSPRLPLSACASRLGAGRRATEGVGERGRQLVGGQVARLIGRDRADLAAVDRVRRLDEADQHPLQRRREVRLGQRGVEERQVAIVLGAWSAAGETGACRTGSGTARRRRDPACWSSRAEVRRARCRSPPSPAIAPCRATRRPAACRRWSIRRCRSRTTTRCSRAASTSTCPLTPGKMSLSVLTISPRVSSRSSGVPSAGASQATVRVVGAPPAPPPGLPAVATGLGVAAGPDAAAGCQQRKQRQPKATTAIATASRGHS